MPRRKAQLPRITESALSRLCAGGPFEAGPDGRIDYRRLLISTYVEFPGRPKPAPYLRQLRLANLDFTGSSLHGVQVAQSRFTNCCFDRADCSMWKTWSTTYEDCRFHKTNLREAALGNLVADCTQNRYVRVDFSESDMRYAHSQAALFEDCQFDGARLKGAAFSASSFHRCSFAGHVYDVEFGGDLLISPDQQKLYSDVPRPALVDVDFSSATLSCVSFNNASLSGIRWPIGDTHLLVTDYPQAIERALADAEGRAGSEGTRRFLGLQRDNRYEGENTAIFYKPDLIETLGAAEADQLARVMAHKP